MLTGQALRFLFLARPSDFFILGTEKRSLLCAEKRSLLCAEKRSLLCTEKRSLLCAEKRSLLCTEKSSLLCTEKRSLFCTEKRSLGFPTPAENRGSWLSGPASGIPPRAKAPMIQRNPDPRGFARFGNCCFWRGRGEGRSDSGWERNCLTPDNQHGLNIPARHKFARPCSK